MIGKRYIAYIGMLLIRIKDIELDQHLENLWYENKDQYYNEVLNIHKNIEDSLKKCTDVSNLYRLGELRKEHFEPFVHYSEEYSFLQESSSFLYFDVFIPKAERKHVFEVRYDEAVIEKARILYNGNIFIAFAELKDGISSNGLRMEIREFLIKCLTSDRWEAITVAPCPIHPNIYLNIIDDNSVFEIDVDNDNNVTINLPYDKEEEIEIFLKDFLNDISFTVNQFYSASTMIQKLQGTAWNADSILNKLSFNYKELIDVPFYRIKKRFLTMKQIRSLSIDLQILNNDFSTYKIKLKRKKEFFSKNSYEYVKNCPFRNYFYDYLKIPLISQSENREIIRLMNDVVTNKYIQYYTLMAAFIGGIVGGIITQFPSILKGIVSIFKIFF